MEDDRDNIHLSVEGRSYVELKKAFLCFVLETDRKRTASKRSIGWSISWSKRRARLCDSINFEWESLQLQVKFWFLYFFSENKKNYEILMQSKIVPLICDMIHIGYAELNDFLNPNFCLNFTLHANRLVAPSMVFEFDGFWKIGQSAIQSIFNRNKKTVFVLCLDAACKITLNLNELIGDSFCRTSDLVLCFHYLHS